MKIWIKIISVLEVIGGIVGLGFVGWVLLSSAINIFTIVFAIVAVVIYIFSFVAGVALWQGRAFGRAASIIIQAIQLPKIISPAIIFMFSFGFDLWIHYLQVGRFSTLGFEFRFLAFNQLFLNSVDAPTGFGISVVSCVFLPALVKYKPQAKRKEVLTPPPPAIEWSDGGRN